MANTHDIVVADKLLHGKEKRVWGDAGYRGIEKRNEHVERNVDWFIAERPGKRKVMDANSPLSQLEKTKASARAKVEYPFTFIKRMFGCSEVRYRGLQKNKERLYLLSGFTNLIKMKDCLLA